jgi:hypothetical protein
MTTLSAAHDTNSPIAPPLHDTGDYLPETLKPRRVQVQGKTMERHPLKSRLILKGDKLPEIIRPLMLPHQQPGDWLVISETVVAIAQERVFRSHEIHVGFWANTLQRFVRRVPYGIGLGSPQTMQCAINEVGLPRILLASAAGAAGKLVGRRGDFYRIAGMQAATIDAASTSPIPEYNDSVVLGPKDPDRTATSYSNELGLPVAIVDVNDIGGSWVLGASPEIDRPLVEDTLRDNPLGQGDELTPFGLLRLIK